MSECRAAGFESGWQLPFLPNEPEQQNGWVAEGGLMEEGDSLYIAKRL